ncbi:hypothetical protein AAMO2058_001045900 [Amorphochlora amoebiformis]
MWTTLPGAVPNCAREKPAEAKTTELEPNPLHTKSAPANASGMCKNMYCPYMCIFRVNTYMGVSCIGRRRQEGGLMGTNFTIDEEKSTESKIRLGIIIGTVLGISVMLPSLEEP